MTPLPGRQTRVRRRPSVFLAYALLTGIIALAVIAPAVYLRVRRDAVESRVASQDAVLRLTRDTLSIALEQLDTASTQLVLDGALTSLPRHYDERNLLLVRAIRERIVGFLNLHPSVEHLSIVYPNEQLFYAPRSGLLDLADYPYEAILEQLAGRRDPSRRIEVAQLDSGAPESAGLTLVKSIPLIHFAPRAYLVLVVSDGLVSDTINRLEGLDDHQIALLAEHRLLASVRLQAPTTRIEELSAGATNGLARIDNTRYIVTTTLADDLGLSLVSLVPADIALAGLRGLNVFMGAIVVVAIAGITIVGVWAADRLRRPLATIAKLLAAPGNGTSPDGEVDLSRIGQDVRRMVMRSRRLQEEVERYAPIVADRRLRQIIVHGGEASRASVSELGLTTISDVPVRSAAIVVVRAEPDQHSSGSAAGELEPLLVAREVLRNLPGPLEWTATDFAESSVLVLCRHSEPVAVADLRHAALELVRAMEAIGFAATAGIGPPVDAMESLPRSFHPARRLADIARMRGEAGVLSPEDLEQSASGDYPFEDEAAVVEAIRRADPGAAVRATKGFLHGVSVRSIFYQQTALLRLVGAVDTVLHDMGESLESMSDHGSPFLTVIQASNARETLRLLSDLYHTITARLEAGRTSRLADLVEKVRHIVHSQMPNDLSLRAIGEQVYLSESYLSRLFREATGEQLRSYIARVRMEEAARLLAGTQLSITEIGRRVGYDRLQSFAKTFKKEVGVTPSEYRRARAVRIE